VLLIWWLACFLWSGTFLFIKIGVAQIPPLTFAWVRLAIALTVLVPLAAMRGDVLAVARPLLARIFAAGIVLLGVNYGLLYWGARRIPSGLAAILQSATPIFALILGCLCGLERATLRKGIAFMLASFGVAVIFRSEIHITGMGGLAGAGAVLASSLCVASAYVWLKSARVSVHPLTVTAIQCAAGLAALAPVALMLEGSPLGAPWSAASAIAVLYLAIGGSVFAFWLNYWLLQRIDASAMLMMGIAEVPIALALGAIALGERLPSGTLAGAVAVLAGVSLITITQRK
jgi:drug/metabolite transporter (DMT)-like permease